MRAPKGFTLIEVLIAVTLFTFLILAVTQNLLSVFDLTRETRAQISANQKAQAVIEAIRAAWQDPLLYRKTCAPLNLPPHVEVKVEGFDPSGSSHPLRFYTQCASAPERPAVAKRVTVAVKDPKGKERVKLTMDIPEP